jgi:hypothetical protein
MVPTENSRHQNRTIQLSPAHIHTFRGNLPNHTPYKHPMEPLDLLHPPSHSGDRPFLLTVTWAALGVTALAESADLLLHASSGRRTVAGVVSALALLAECAVALAVPYLGGQVQKWLPFAAWALFSLSLTLRAASLVSSALPAYWAAVWGVSSLVVLAWGGVLTLVAVGHSYPDPTKGMGMCVMLAVTGAALAMAHVGALVLLRVRLGARGAPVLRAAAALLRYGATLAIAVLGLGMTEGYPWGVRLTPWLSQWVLVGIAGLEFVLRIALRLPDPPADEGGALPLRRTAPVRHSVQADDAPRDPVVLAPAEAVQDQMIMALLAAAAAAAAGPPAPTRRPSDRQPLLRAAADPAPLASLQQPLLQPAPAPSSSSASAYSASAHTTTASVTDDAPVPPPPDTRNLYI